MKKFLKNVFKQTFFGLLLGCAYFSLYSQNVMDINAAGAKNIDAQESDNLQIKQMFKDADRYRRFDYNKQLINLKANNIGDTLLLNFFDDKQYKSVIQNVTITLKGRTSITSKITGSEFAYCYMVVSENTITISAEFPKEDQFFFASVKDGQAYMAQIKKSELDKTAIESFDDILMAPRQQQQRSETKSNAKDIDDPVIIDVLFVYTPAAEWWAFDDWMVTDIHDLIDQALQRSNITMANSGTGITFRIAYEHLTDYVETNTTEDLYRITDPWDGYMDEVHVLRDEYYADEIVFIPAVDFTGGVAWLLDDPNGFYPDYYAVALSRVQQSSWTYTVVHEVGHNMGCHHHIDQNFQPGPGLFYFSSGWRGIINGENLCTVMTYEAGNYFADGQNHVRIPYFSSPEIDVDGVTIGDPVTADNALTLKITKTAVANYRTPPDEPTLIINPLSLNFSNVLCGTTSASQIINVSGASLLDDINYVISGADESSFHITPISWNPATGGQLSVTFSPTEAKDYNAIITFITSGAPEKVITLSGTGMITYLITATASENGTITPSGTITVNQGEEKQFNFYPNEGYEIEDVLVDDVSVPEAIINRFYVFENVENDHTIHAIFYHNSVNENIFDNVKIYSYLNHIFIQNETNVALMSVAIFDIIGQLIHYSSLTTPKTVIPLQVANGIYYVRLSTPEGSVIVKKVIITL
jgi:hypothetical protein